MKLGAAYGPSYHAPARREIGPPFKPGRALETPSCELVDDNGPKVIIEPRVMVEKRVIRLG